MRAALLPRQPIDFTFERRAVYFNWSNCIATWTGIFIAKDDTMYVADSESWGKDEPGWKKGICIGNAKTGKVNVFIEDMESTTEEHSGAEGVGVDKAGNVYGAVAPDARKAHPEIGQACELTGVSALAIAGADRHSSRRRPSR